MSPSRSLEEAPNGSWLAKSVRLAVDFAFKYRRTTVAVIHVGLIVLSNFLAFTLRFDAAIPPVQAQAFRQTIIVVVVIRTLVFIPMRLYEGLWRYTGIWDLQRIVAGVLLSSALLFGLLDQLLVVPNYPHSIYLIDTVLLVTMMGGLRLGRRIYREARRSVSSKRVLVLGAGDAGEMIVRDMLKNVDYGMQPVGFIDDNEGKVGKRIHGIPVLGTRDRIGEFISKERPDEILVAIPRESPSALRKIAESLQPYKTPITTLPSIRDLVQGVVTVNHIRPLAIEDLLSRAPVGLDFAPVRSLITGRRVLVTGAGGSIGSELCRQIAALAPHSLAVLDRYENSLHAIGVELGDRSPHLQVHSYLADITDRPRIRSVFYEFRPEIVFHAAAHKHVPMVEMNPSEGLKNNVLGTRIVAEESLRFDVDRVVYISTDKAVNPTSVMGATKRVGEFCVQDLASAGRTSFCVVRFGNVLGSNGSVVPRFLEQIKAGGPVTVTHPEMRRFFMLIPEAVQLVLHAAAHAEPGMVYVLEMGDQISVAEMARNLIRLSGFVPGDDIQIRYIGLRPGEKLYEELIGVDETAEPSGTEGIHRIRPNHRDRQSEIRMLTDRAIASAQAGDDEEVLSLLCRILPTYRQSGLKRRRAEAATA